MKRRTFLSLSGATVFAGCVEPQALLSAETIDPTTMALARSRAADGILRAEDVRAGLEADTVGAQGAQVIPREILRAGSGQIVDYLNGSVSLPITTPDVKRSELDRLYAQRGYSPIWFNNGVRTQGAFELFSAQVNAPVDGLLPGDYLPGERSLASKLEVGSAALAQVDLELTAGLLRYIRDARQGRYTSQPDVDIVPLAQAVIASLSIDDALGEAVNQGQVYQLLRSEARREAQFLDGARFDAYRVTMESLRAEPVSLGGNGKYLISNIAAQEVFAMRDGRMELGMTMVVGRPTRATPVADDTIISIKFSPDWTAPRSIVKKDLIKKAPQIFEDMGIEVRRGGEVIDPRTVSWNENQVANYDFIQPPGPLNVLGGARFTLSNSEAIYMHDSPDRVLFNKVNRIYSSGCMRLEKSAELAFWLLRDQDPTWTMERVREAMQQPNFSFEVLENPVPVRTVYLEAWPSFKGGLRVVPDIYGINDGLRERMGITQRTSSDPGDLSQFRTSIF